MNSTATTNGAVLNMDKMKEAIELIKNLPPLTGFIYSKCIEYENDENLIVIDTTTPTFKNMFSLGNPYPYDINVFLPYPEDIGI